MESQKLYTYSEVAPLLSDKDGKPLTGRSAVSRRIGSLAKRGQPLTIEAGELVQFGSRKLITELGLARLREFSPARAGRPISKSDNTQAIVH